MFGVRVESVTGAKYLTQGTGLAFRAVQTPDYGVKQSVKWTLEAVQKDEQTGKEVYVKMSTKNRRFRQRLRQNFGYKESSSRNLPDNGNA